MDCFARTESRRYLCTFHCQIGYKVFQHPKTGLYLSRAFYPKDKGQNIYSALGL